MKNFDIEQLQRKNIYRLPNDFFSEMQENVLQKTVQKQQIIVDKAETKVVLLKSRTWYSIAAVIALILGFGFIVKNVNTDSGETLLISNNFSKNHTQKVWNSKDNYHSSENKNHSSHLMTQNDIMQDNNASNVAKTISIARMPTNSLEREIINEPKIHRNEENMEKLIVSFTSSELADVSKNTDMDVYLDLYN